MHNMNIFAHFDAKMCSIFKKHHLLKIPKVCKQWKRMCGVQTRVLCLQLVCQGIHTYNQIGCIILVGHTWNGTLSPSIICPVKGKPIVLQYIAHPIIIQDIQRFVRASQFTIILFHQHGS